MLQIHSKMKLEGNRNSVVNKNPTVAEEQKKKTMASHQKAPRAVDWSNPPPEFLSAITKRLLSGIDILRCRSVCKNWRASINPNPRCLSPFLPLKFPISTLPFIIRPNETLLLVARTVFLVKPLPFSNDSSSWILTVEEVVPGKLRILYPLSNDRVTSFPSNFPKCLNLLDFHVSEIAKSYVFKYGSDWEDVSGICKVVLCFDSTAMVLYGEGTLIGLRLKSGIWGFVRHSLVTSFSDVITFKGMIYGVDCKGNLYIVDHKTMKVIKKVVVVDLPVPGTTYRKRFVEQEYDGKLWIVAWRHEDINSSSDIRFTVFCVDEQKKKWVRTSLPNWVMFVYLDCCFIVCARDLNIGNHSPKLYQSSIRNAMTENYFVFSQSCFVSPGAHFLYSRRLFEGTSINLSIGYDFSSSEGKGRYDYIRSTIAEALWPPPTWFWPDTFTSSGGDEESEGFNSWEQCVSTGSKEELPPSSVVAPHIGSANCVQASVPMITGIDIHTALGDSSVLRIQDFNACASTEVFEGVKIKSNLLPTLQNIWEKYGNILEGSTIRSGDLIARSLESLATAVLILQSSSGQTLNKIQAEYLSSTLSDLQHMHFKLDWLVPFVENALAIHKSKPLIDALKEFSEAKARVQEMKLKVLDELAKLDEVEEDMKFVFEKIPFLDSVDLNRNLGEGIC